MLNFSCIPLSCHTVGSWPIKLRVSVFSVRPFKLRSDFFQGAVFFLLGVCWGMGVRVLGAVVVHMLRYQDHHVYQNEEIELACGVASRTRAQWIVTTEKDAIRIPESSDRTRILVLDIELDVVRDGNILESMVSNAAASP